MAVQPVHVLLAIRSPFVGAMVCRLLRGDGAVEFVVVMVDGNTVVTEALRAEPTIVVLDVSLLERRTLTLAQHIKRERPATRIVILSHDTSEEYQRAAREVGASTCLAATAAFPSLIELIKELALV